MSGPNDNLTVETLPENPDDTIPPSDEPVQRQNYFDQKINNLIRTKNSLLNQSVKGVGNEDELRQLTENLSTLSVGQSTGDGGSGAGGSGNDSFLSKYSARFKKQKELLKREAEANAAENARQKSLKQMSKTNELGDEIISGKSFYGGKSKSRRSVRKSRRVVRKSRRNVRKSKRSVRKSRRNVRKSKRVVRKSRKSVRKTRRNRRNARK